MKYRFIRSCLCWLLLASISVQLQAQSKSEELLAEKNFYLLYLLQKNQVESPGKVFKGIAERLHSDTRIAMTDCTEAACLARSVKFSTTEIESAGKEFARLTLKSAAWKKLVEDLRRSGAYSLYAAEPDTAFIRKVWQADANGINYVLCTYIEGKAPIYPKIDSISFDRNDTDFKQKVAEKIQQYMQAKKTSFYTLPYRLALDALLLNGRDEATRYQPLTEGENLEAANKVDSINWNNYPYSLILVPGLGPEHPGVKLDPNGAKRCDSAVLRYHAGLAPFIVVSGGHVHPNKTPYCEAIEMKKYMVEKLRIPASAIIIEPHARHTTTNLRNANRLIYLLKMPSDKPVLIVTDNAQTKYINGGMHQRVQKELGYLPFVSMKQLSLTETEYLPSVNSLQINPIDPLDP